MRDDPVILTGAAILITAGIFAAYPITLVVVLGVAAVWFLGHHLDKAYLARTTRDRALRDAADREHALVMQGDERGVYGNYPPAA